MIEEDGGIEEENAGEDDVKRWYQGVLQDLQFCDISKEKIEIFEFKRYCDEPLIQEEKERLSDFLSSTDLHSNFVTIFLVNKSINLYRPLLIDSCIDQLWGKTEYKILSGSSFMVDEEIVSLLLLGIKVNIEEELLLDYFLFFRSLHLKRGMVEILYRIQTQIENQKGKEERILYLYNFFQRSLESCECNDKEVMNAIRVCDRSPIHILLLPKENPHIFKSSLSLLLFSYLKNIYLDDKESSLFRTHLNDLKFIKFLNLSPRVEGVEKHPDFDNYYEPYLDGKRDRSKQRTCHDYCRKMFEFAMMNDEKKEDDKTEDEAHSYSSSLTDVILRTEDGKEFPCHLGFLIWRYSFFHSMLFFGGQETDDFKKTKIINILELRQTPLRLILEFCYLGKIPFTGEERKKPSYEDLLVCLRHSDQFMCSKLLYNLLGKIPEVLDHHELLHNENEIVRKLEAVREYLILDDVKPKIMEKILESLNSKIERLSKIHKDNKKEIESMYEKFLKRDQPSAKPDILRKRRGFKFPLSLRKGRPYSGRRPQFVRTPGFMITPQSRRECLELRKERDRLKEALGKSVKMGKMFKERCLDKEEENERVKSKLKMAAIMGSKFLKQSFEMKKKLKKERDRVKFLMKELKEMKEKERTSK